MTLDVLAIGAHPDDVEVGIGGVVRKLVEQGHQVGILDLTQGELGSRGTVEERRTEAQQAAEILGAVCRENAQLPDGSLANTTEQQRKVIPFIRMYRPRVILAPMRGDLHPDHDAAHFLVRDANHFAGLTKLDADSGLEPWRAERVYFYGVYRELEMPTLVVEVSAEFEVKLEALRAFRSQFHNPEYDGPKTYIASEQFWESMKTRAAYWGTRLTSMYGANQSPESDAGVQTRYGECLFSEIPVAVSVLPGLEELT